MTKSNFARKKLNFTFESSCAYLHPDHSEERNKKITNKIKVEIENLEKARNKGINQLKAITEHQSEKILTLET